LQVSAGALPKCLHARSASGTDASGCKGDVLKLGEHQTVKNAIEALELGSVKIDFVGCHNAIFGTTWLGKHHYEISYKVVPLTSPEATFMFLLPVMHELAHVFQIEHYGGTGKMEQVLDTQPKIELGADFIAGALYHWRWGAFNTTAFSANVELMGDYKADNSDYHGRPEDRSAAFQFGFDYPLTGNSRNIHFGGHAPEIWDAHENFQADDLDSLTGLD
jgi:hypothetical protein